MSKFLFEKCCPIPKSGLFWLDIPGKVGRSKSDFEFSDRLFAPPGLRFAPTTLRLAYTVYSKAQYNRIALTQSWSQTIALFKPAVRRRRLRAVVRPFLPIANDRCRAHSNCDRYDARAMNIADCLVKAFPKATSWAREEDIEANPNLMELPGSVDLIAAVPAYMLWCARHSDSTEVVPDFTLAALAEYGRCRSTENVHLNFLYRCSVDQLQAVISFLEWASEAIPFHHRETVERALRNWRNAGNDSLRARGQ